MNKSDEFFYFTNRQLLSKQEFISQKRVGSKLNLLFKARHFMKISNWWHIFRKQTPILGKEPGGELLVGSCDYTVTTDISKATETGHVFSQLFGPLGRMIWQKYVPKISGIRAGSNFSQFEDLLKQRALNSGAESELVVFFHGFDSDPQDGMERGSSFHYALKATGRLGTMYNWASHGFFTPQEYFADMENATNSVKQAKQMLLYLCSLMSTKNLILVSHSMGSLILCEALFQLKLELGEQAPVFKQIVMIAPDVAKSTYLDVYSSAISKSSDNLIILVSKKDKALLFSQALRSHGDMQHLRLGQAKAISEISGTTFIDYSALDDDFGGHVFLPFLLARLIDAQSIDDMPGVVVDRSGSSPVLRIVSAGLKDMWQDFISRFC